MISYPNNWYKEGYYWKLTWTSSPNEKRYLRHVVKDSRLYWEGIEWDYDNDGPRMVGPYVESVYEPEDETDNSDGLLIEPLEESEYLAAILLV